MDWLLVELKITKYTNTLFKYGKDGVLMGKDVASTDYSLNNLKLDIHIYSEKESEEDKHEDIYEPE